jgi:hypothetical protein
MLLRLCLVGSGDCDRDGEPWRDRTAVHKDGYEDERQITRHATSKLTGCDVVTSTEDNTYMASGRIVE